MSSAAQTPAGPITGSLSRPRRRVPFWDNARYACIVLVVLGHAIQRLTYDSDIAMAMYLTIYAFHMPAFAIIAGYFSKSAPPSRRQMARVITDILVPYVIFELLWTLTKWLVEGQVDPNLTKPSWTLWFLLALGIFRLVLPYLALLRWPLAWSLLISIGAGYLPNVDSTFSLSRTLGFLPFFVLGWWLREHDFVNRLRLIDFRPWWLRAIAVVLLGASAFVAWNWVGVWRNINLDQWFFYADSYSDLGNDVWWSGGVRLLFIVLGVVLTSAFFILIPRRTQWWTRFGQYTMYVYLLHSFVLYPFRESGILRDAEPTWIWLPAVIVLAVAISLALATGPVRWVFRPLVEPRVRWLFSNARLSADTSRRDDPTGSRRPAERPKHDQSKSDAPT
ncbi:fucose 4-O-acetylase [Microbacterium sp. CH12i]|uniref:acyltransferase family protein n=1 Tax=Microbacterium sp. CH12i TaxID=1479651 RepID=UPI000461C1A1|nr:acyltransferase family protein [Microbacterium sp. CH12i]KDA05822.1 fucose 4-O-acetylase [Microbacterium sp. CH12i]